MFSNVITNIKDTVLILSVVSSIFLGIWGQKQKEEAERAHHNLHRREIEYVDEYGRHVKEVTELRYTLSEALAVKKAKEKDLSAAQLELKKAVIKIEEMGIKLKRTENYTNVDFEVIKDSLRSVILRGAENSVVGIAPISTPHLDIQFTVDSDSVLATAKYKANITTVLNRKPDKLTKNGNKRLFLARLIDPRYDYWATVVIDDPDATINSVVHINFQDKKGKRK
jgi:hypothetical protein